MNLALEGGVWPVIQFAPVLLTRALVRTVLSRYAPIAPADWAFEPGRSAT